MAPVQHDVLVGCFEDKLCGEPIREAEHIHYKFVLDGVWVAQTHMSPKAKIRELDDSLLAST